MCCTPSRRKEQPTAYSFRIEVFTLVEGNLPQPTGEVPSEVEVDRTSSAYIKAWSLVNAACHRMQAETGCETSIGDLHMECQS